MNGGSGRHDADDTRQIIEVAMHADARTHRIFLIEDVDQIDATVQQAVDAAKAEGAVVVAVGGDGTISAVANTVLNNACLFGAIPQGTFNYFGRTHGIPEDINESLQDLLHGEPVPVQVGLVNGRAFLVNASVGLYPELLEDREAFKQKYGRSRLVAIWSAIATVFGRHRQLNMTLEQGDQRVAMNTTTLFIGNNKLQLDQVGMPQAAAVVNGELAAIAVRPIGKLAMLWLGACGALGRLGDTENVVGFSFRKLTVAPRRSRIKVAADGEIMWLQTPLEFRIAPEPLMLIKPRRTTESDDKDRDAIVSGELFIEQSVDQNLDVRGRGQ